MPARAAISSTFAAPKPSALKTWPAASRSLSRNSAAASWVGRPAARGAADVAGAGRVARGTGDLTMGRLRLGTSRQCTHAGYRAPVGRTWAYLSHYPGAMWGISQVFRRFFGRIFGRASRREVDRYLVAGDEAAPVAFGKQIEERETAFDEPFAISGIEQFFARLVE